MDTHQDCCIVRVAVADDTVFIAPIRANVAPGAPIWTFGNHCLAAELQTHVSLAILPLMLHIAHFQWYSKEDHLGD